MLVDMAARGLVILEGFPSAMRQIPGRPVMEEDSLKVPMVKPHFLEDLELVGAVTSVEAKVTGQMNAGQMGRVETCTRQSLAGVTKASKDKLSLPTKSHDF